MPTARQLPTLSAPSLRTTKSADQWVQYLEGDLAEIQKQVPIWVRTKATEEIANQIELGNSKQYTSVVDGSSSKPVALAERSVTVLFVSAILARNLAKAKRVLEMAIRRVTKTRTGLLATGWEWYLQKGGSSGGFKLLGDAIPTELMLSTGDALVLVPKAPYAWFVDYKATRAQRFKPRKRARAKKLGSGSVLPRGYGFMIYAAKQLRPELRRIGIAVLIGTLTGPASRARAGVPVLMLAVTKRAAGIKTYGG